MSTREEILNIIERNSRIDVKELSVLLGADEILVANELKAMEDEGVICGFNTMIDWSKTDIERVNALWRQLCAVSSLGGLMLSQNAPHLRPLLPLLIRPCPFRLPTEICVLSCTMHAHAQTCTYTHTHRCEILR